MRRALGLTVVPGLLASLMTAPTSDPGSLEGTVGTNFAIQAETASAETSGPADSDLGSATQPFQVASQQTSSSFWVLLSVWHQVETKDLGRGPMGLVDDEELGAWADTYGRDLPSDREVEEFDDALFYIGQMLRHAQNDIGSGLSSTGHCAVEIPDMADVDCGPHDDLDIRNGVAAGSPDSPLTVDVLHSSAEAGFHCGVGGVRRRVRRSDQQLARLPTRRLSGPRIRRGIGYQRRSHGPRPRG